MQMLLNYTHQVILLTILNPTGMGERGFPCIRMCSGFSESSPRAAWEIRSKDQPACRNPLWVTTKDALTCYQQASFPSLPSYESLSMYSADNSLPPSAASEMWAWMKWRLELQRGWVKLISSVRAVSGRHWISKKPEDSFKSKFSSDWSGKCWALHTQNQIKRKSVVIEQSHDVF